MATVNMDTLYLVQHGQAVDKDQNPERPLSTLGRKETERVAALAAALDLPIGAIWHSGKTRAKETAEIYGRALQRDAIHAVDGLHPTDDVAPVANRVAELTESVMLVGHLPFMERITGYLTAGNADATPVAFRNAGIVCLRQQDRQWQTAWQLHPL